MEGRLYTSNHMKLLLTFKHLFYHGIKSCILAWKKSVSNVCGQEVIVCFMSGSFAN